MKTLKQFRCGLFGHKYQVLQEFSPTSRRVICNKCGGDWAMDDRFQAFVEWDGEFEELYTMLGHTVKRRP